VSEGLQNTKFCVIALITVMLVGVLILSSAVSSLISNVVIQSTGQISTTDIIAASGSAEDIQAAVDWVVANGGIGNVYIPNGTFNFVDVGEPWLTVNIPSGVNVFGAPTERDANGQVVEWKTILIMPWDVPGDSSMYREPCWFHILGNGDPNKPSRVSDIKLVGYRSIDPNSVTLHIGIFVDRVVDFRIDHCYFEHVCKNAIIVWGQGPSPSLPTQPCRGVIDHCFFVNIYGHVKTGIADCTCQYGILVGRGYGDFWEDDVTEVLGKYTNYTAFVEDCYFEKWRHCIAANDGGHYVIRNSTINEDFGYGSLDAHGWGKWDGTEVTQVGTRAIEVYNCEMLNPYNPDEVQRDAIYIRGGACIAFNNTVTEYTQFIYATREADPEVSKCYPHDIYVWDNELPSDVSPVVVYNDPDKGAPEEGVDYFLQAPITFNYEPYSYPHPLTLEGTP
jgi:hypothetical protein